MAVIRERPRKDGAISYIVLYRFGGRGSKQGALTFDDKKTAEAFAAAVAAHGAARALEMHGIDPTPRKPAAIKKLTVSDWVRQHIDQLTGVEQYTLDKYEEYLRNDITPHFGNIPLTALADTDIAAWIKHMETHGGRDGKGHAPKTLRNKHGFLSAALNAAVGKHHIPANPAAGRRLPRGDADDNHDMRMLTRDEFRRLYDATDEPSRPLVEFLVTSGMRWGEASALTPAHIDIEAGTALVRQAWKYSSKGYTLGPPKTRRSRRTVDVSSRLLKKLDLTGEWVFTNSTGGPVRYQQFWRDVWNPAVAKAELDPRPTPHDLRHTYASWQLTGGTPLVVVSRQMGHESIKITADIYADVDRVSAKAAATLMDRLLS